MAELTIRELVRHARAALQQLGPVGAFLLAELDASISRGIESPPEQFTEDGVSQNDERAAQQDRGTRILNEKELLEILVSVLQTYLVTLPEVSNSLTTYLREEFEVDQIEVSLDPSLLNENNQQSGRVSLVEIVPPPLAKKPADAMRELCQIVANMNFTE